MSTLARTVVTVTGAILLVGSIVVPGDQFAVAFFGGLLIPLGLFWRF